MVARAEPGLVAEQQQENGAYQRLLPAAGDTAMSRANGGEVDDDDRGRVAGPSRLWTEAKRVLSLSVPISAAEVLSFMAYLITTAQVGHLGALELSAITLAHTVYHITGLSLVVGMASAVETFCGQAYGAARYRVLGAVLQRAVLLCWLTSVVPLVVLGWAAEPLMARVFRQPRAIVSLSARYVRVLSPVLFLWSGSTCIRSYMASQGAVLPLAVVSAAYTALTPLLNHLFMYRAGWGMLGAAVAYNVLQAAQLAMLLAAMAWLHFFRQPPPQRTWGGLRSEALQGWGAYLKVALPSGAAICLDWWSYEAVILLAGLTPEAGVALGAMGICFSTHALLFMVVEGCSAAASTRVSNELGAGHARGARFACRVALGLGVAAPLALSGGLLVGARPWARLYASDPRVVDLVVRLMPILCISNVTDSAVSVMSGVLRGSGRQELSFRVNLLVFWVLGLPAAALLGLRLRMGALGLWIAMAGAGALQAAILLACVARFDWQDEARKAHARIRSAEGHAAEGGCYHVAAADEAQHPGGAAGAYGEANAANGQWPPGEQTEAAPAAPLHLGQDSRHGVHEPLLTAPHPPL